MEIIYFYLFVGNKRKLRKGDILERKSIEEENEEKNEEK